MTDPFGVQDLPIRADLRDVSAYGAPQLDVPVRLNTNENPHPPSPEVLEAIGQAIAAVLPGIDRYPDRDAVALRAALAGYLSRSAGVDIAGTHVWAANGSNEVLQQLLQAFGGPGQPALGFGPTYSMHKIIARGANTDYVEVPRSDDFTVDVNAAIAAIGEVRPTVTFICSPNNPTGTQTALDVIDALYTKIDEVGAGVLVVDEAYAEFSSSASAVTLLAGRPRLIVTRTMSKAFAFAGGRLGYLAADPSVIDALLRVRLPYHLSSLTQAAAIAALAHEPELAVAVADLCRQRGRMELAIQDLGLPLVPSDANFLLFGANGDQSKMWRGLLEAGVLVRDVGLPGWLRVTAGTEAETTAFISALQQYVLAVKEGAIFRANEQETA